MSLEVPLGEVAPPTPLVVIPHVAEEEEEEEEEEGEEEEEEEEEEGEEEGEEEEEEEEEEGKHIYHWKHKIICKIIITKCRLMA